MKMRISFVALMLSVSACLGEPEFQGADFGNYDPVLVEQLRPGGQRLWAFSSTPVDFDPRLFSFTNSDGSTATLIDPFTRGYELSITNTPPPIRNYLATRDGDAVSLEPLAQDMELIASLLSDDTLFQVWCSVSATVRAGGGQLVLEGQWCNFPALLGTGPTSNRAVLASLIANGELAEISVDAGVVTATASAITLPTELVRGSIRFIEQPSDDVIAAVSEVSGVWTYWKTGDEPLVATGLTGAASGSQPVVRASDGTLRVVTLTGLYSWDVEGDGTVTTITATPAPSINAAWVSVSGPGAAIAREMAPNPDAPTLEMPVAVQARRLLGDTFVVYDVPTTPCAIDASCRAIGESRVVGLVGDGDALGVVYDIWSWHLSTRDENMKGAYYAPLSTP